MKAWIFGILVLAACGCARAIDVPKATTDAGVLIDEYDGQGDNLERARELLASVFKERKDYAPAYVQAARWLLNSGHIVSEQFVPGTTATASQLLVEAIRLDARNCDALVLFAHAMRLQGGYGVALEYLRRAREMSCNNHWLYANQGDALLWLDRYDESYESYARVVAMGPGNTASQLNAYTHALEMQARVEVYRKNIEQVLFKARQATAIARATDAWAWGNNAEVLIFAGYFREAEEFCRKALSIMQYGAARRALAMALYAQWAQKKDSNPAAAEVQYQEAKQLFPNIHEAGETLYQYHPSIALAMRDRSISEGTWPEPVRK